MAWVPGTAGNDVLIGTEDVDTIEGLEGDDDLRGRGGNDGMSGGNGADVLFGEGGNDALYGVNTLPLTEAVDDLEVDQLFGGDGDDALVMGLGDIGEGGAGFDAAELDFRVWSAPVSLDFRTLTPGVTFALPGGGWIRDVEAVKIWLGSGDDIVHGTDFHGQFAGFEGNDFLFGYGGLDFLSGGDGDDHLEGGDGNDSILGGDGRDVMLGGAGDDEISHDWGTGFGGGADLLDGGDGDDVLRGDVSAAFIGGAGRDLAVISVGGLETVDLSNVLVDGRLPGGGEAHGIEEIWLASGGAPLTFIGSPLDEAATGHALNDTLAGNAGDDQLFGFAGADILIGGPGSDYLDAGQDNDLIYADHEDWFITGGIFSTWDMLVYDLSALTGAGVLEFTTTSLLVNGQEPLISAIAQFEIILGDGGWHATARGAILAVPEAGFYNRDALVGGAGDDVLEGSRGYDILSGNGGADTLAGGTEDDQLAGGDGDDVLNGGTGDDLLSAGSGNDSVDGGDDFDVLDYSDAAAGVTVNLGGSAPQATGGSGLDQIAGIESVRGSAFADVLTAAPGAPAAAPDLVKHVLTDNTSRQTAVSLDQWFELTGNPEIGNATTTPHASVRATNAGGLDGAWYSFTVLEAGASATFDIDRTFGVRTVLELYDANGALVAVAGANSFDPGSEVVFDENQNPPSYTYDPFLTYTFASPGTYYVNIRDAGSAGSTSYTLNVSLTGAPVQTDALIGSTLEGGIGNDILTGAAGIDTASYAHASGGVVVNLATGQTSGADGVDTLTSIENVIGSNYDDALTGAAGINTVSYEAAGSAVVVDLAAGRASGGGGADTIVGFENVVGSSYDDMFVGDSGANHFNGGAGSDTASYAGAGAAIVADLALGEVTSGAGATDRLLSIEGVIGTGFADTLRGASSNDVLDGGGGADLIDGRGGWDTASYASAGGAVTVDLAAQTATGGAGVDTLISIESVIGSAFADVLIASDAANVILGGAGDDVITPSGFSANGDIIDGGGGVDTLVLAHASNVDLLFGSISSPTTFWRDHSIGSIENVVGSGFADNIWGDERINALSGGGGDDYIQSGLGNDRVSGDAGNDVLVGSLGADRLEGGAGHDTFWQGIEDDVDIIFGGVQGADSGFDTLDYRFAIAGVVVQLSGYSTTREGRLLTTFSGIEAVIGSEFDDALIGNAQDNLLIGGLGQDWLVGGGGDDVFDLSQVLQDFANVDAVFGGSAEADSGYDTIDFSGAPYLAPYSGVVVDLASYAARDDGSLLATLSGVEAVVGTLFGDTLVGDAANNRFTPGDGADWVVGGAGDDWFVQEIEPGDTLFGDAGVDTIDYSIAAGGVIVQLSGSSMSAGLQLATFSGIENAVGSNFDDELLGTSGANELRGEDGSDRIEGGVGADRLFGGAGDDRFVQAIELNFDQISGEAGFDTIDYSGASAAVTVQLSGYSTSGGATLALFSGIEAAVGSAFDDALIGNAASNRITGGAGADWLVGQGGDDTFVQIIDTTSIDRLFGDAGIDTIDYGAASAGVVVQLSGYSTSGGVTLATFNGIENAAGTAFNDALIGNASDNRITGGAGADWLVGGAGNDVFAQNSDTSGIDRLFGDAGTDTIDYSGAGAGVTVQLSGYSTSGGATLATFAGIENAIGTSFSDALIGNASANTLIGGGGGDWLVGGGGADTFVYKSIADGAGDSIRDFSQIENDLVDLSAIDADAALDGDQFFSFATSRTAGVFGEAVVTSASATVTMLSLHLDADNVADMVLQIVHQPGVSLNASDFVL